MKGPTLDPGAPMEAGTHAAAPRPMTIIYLATEDVANSQVSGKVHFWALAQQLQQRGHQVIVVAPRFSQVEKPQAGQIQVVRLFAPGKSALGIFCFEIVLAAHVLWLRRKFRPNAVLVRGGGPGWFMGLIFLMFRVLGIPVVLECNGIVWRELRARGKSKLLILNAYLSAWQQALACNLIIGVSQGITDAYRRVGWRRLSRCRTIPNGTDPAQFQFTAADRRQARELLGIPASAVVAGYVGVFSPWHDVSGMVGAAEMLQSEGHDDVKIVLVGRGALFEWACQQKSEKNLELLMLPGEVAGREQLSRWIACFDIGLCVYTDLEGSPLKMFEYMAAGIPIVGSGFPQILEYCQLYNIGIGLAESGPSAIASAIVTMRDAWNHWQQVGSRNRELVLDKFSWGRVAANVEGAILDTQNDH